MTEWLEQAGKVFAQAVFAAPAGQRAKLQAKLKESGAPEPLLDPLKRSIAFEDDVKAALDNLVAGPLRGFTLLTSTEDGGRQTELVLQTLDGRRIYIDVSPDFTIINDIDIITPVLRMRAQMLQDVPLYGGLVLVTRDVSEKVDSQVKADMAEDPETTGAVRVVEYQGKKTDPVLLAAIREIAARPFPGSVSLFTSTVLEVLQDEVRNGSTGRYLRPSDRYVRLSSGIRFDAFFERSADDKLILISVREGTINNDPAEGSSQLRRDLDTVFNAEEYVAAVGGILVVTDHLPRSAVDAFVAQIDEAKSPIAVVLADVTGPKDYKRLVQALQQAAYQPGQDYS